MKGVARRKLAARMSGLEPEAPRACRPPWGSPPSCRLPRRLKGLASLAESKRESEGSETCR